MVDVEYRCCEYGDKHGQHEKGRNQLPVTPLNPRDDFVTMGNKVVMTVRAIEYKPWVPLFENWFGDKFDWSIVRDKKKFTRAWQLNERHYGDLTGLNKLEVSKKLGEEKVHKFRRSWDLKPKPLDKHSPYHPSNINTYKNVPNESIPDSESLKDTFIRVTNYYDTEIKNNLQNGNLLISAHGNSIRALCKYLFKINELQISNLEIPTGNPLLIEINQDQKINSCKYLDQDRARDLVVF